MRTCTPQWVPRSHTLFILGLKAGEWTREWGEEEWEKTMALKLAGRCLSSDVIRHLVWEHLCFSRQHLVTHRLYWIGQDLSGGFLIFTCPNLPELFLHSNRFSITSCWDPLIHFMLYQVMIHRLRTTALQGQIPHLWPNHRGLMFYATSWTWLPASWSRPAQESTEARFRAWWHQKRPRQMLILKMKYDIIPTWPPISRDRLSKW